MNSQENFPYFQGQEGINFDSPMKRQHDDDINNLNKRREKVDEINNKIERIEAEIELYENPHDEIQIVPPSSLTLEELQEELRKLQGELLRLKMEDSGTETIH